MLKSVFKCSVLLILDSWANAAKNDLFKKFASLTFGQLIIKSFAHLRKAFVRELLKLAQFAKIIYVDFSQNKTELF